MLRRFLSVVVAALLIGGTDARATDDAVRFTIAPKDGSKPLTVELKESTDAFVRIFKDTCFDNRKSLSNLRAIASKKRWDEMPGPYPLRREGSTTEIAWNIYDGDVPYNLALATYDDTSPALTCTLSAIALEKAALVPVLQNILSLQIRRKLAQGEYNTTLLETSSDPALRVACSTGRQNESFDGQCGLVRPIAAHSRIDHLNAACAFGIARRKRLASGASECPS